MRHLSVDAESAGQRLDNYLMRLLKGVPKTHVYRVIRSGEVRVNKGRAAADTRVAEGDTIRLPPLRLPAPSAMPPAPAREFPILYEDDHLLAIDKPAGVAVHGGSGVDFGVIEQLRRSRPQARFLELVHRLDRETSGILLLALRRSALTGLQAQFRGDAVQGTVPGAGPGSVTGAAPGFTHSAPESGRRGGIHKVYAAGVFGSWPPNVKVIDLPLHKYSDAAGMRNVRVVEAGHPDGRRSITLVKRLQLLPWGGGQLSLLDVTLKTGRTHQIRVHLAHHGHPIMGDPKYGDFERNRALARETRFDRMCLHARALTFDHPASGERITLVAPLPNDFAALFGAAGAPANPTAHGR